MSKKEFSLCFILVFSCFFFSTSVESATYRLIPENFLAIGNHWEYQIHITKDEGDPVNWWGTLVWDITQSVNISGFNTIKTQQVYTIPGVVSDTEFQYHFLSSEYLVEVREEGNDSYETVRNDDPWEIFPIWVSDTDNNRYVGHGEYNGHDKVPPYYDWTGFNDYHITYLRQETITVPAGTFNCIVVSSREDWEDDSGWWGYCNQNTWMSPSVGVIKYEEECWVWNNDEKVGYDETVLTGELTSTNVQSGQPSIAKDLTTYDFHDSGDSTNFHVWNDGTGTLDYNVSISEGIDYFTVSPLSGSSTNSSDKKTHTVTVNRSNIPPGQTVMGKVEIISMEADDSPQYINLSAQGGAIKAMPWIPLLLGEQ